MFNFRDLIPWAQPTDYQKLSEDMYQAYKQEKIMANKVGEFSYSVGPSISFDDGASITFKQTGGLTTTVELGHKHVQSLIGLLETVLAHSGKPNEQ